MLRRLIVMGSLAIVLAGCPNAANTGPATTCTTPTEVGYLIVDDGGTHTYSCIHAGAVNISNGSDVTITDLTVSGGSGTYAFQMHDAATKVHVTGCDISGAFSDSGFYIDHGSAWVDGCELHGLTVGADGFKIGMGESTQVLSIKNSYVHNLSPTGCGGHGDGLQVTGPIGSLTLDQNTIIGGSNGAVQISPEVPSMNGWGPIKLTFNHLDTDCATAEYMLRIYQDQGHSIPGIEVAGNGVEPGVSGYYPPDRDPNADYHDNQDCAWDANLQPVNGSCLAID